MRVTETLMPTRWIALAASFGVACASTTGNPASQTSPPRGNDSPAGTVSATSGGSKGGGLCAPGPYPAPSLTGMPTRVYSAAGDGLFEGPVWLAGRGVLLFSEMSFSAPIPPSLVHELTPGANTVKLLSADSGTNGLALDRDGSVIGGSHKVQGIVRIDPATGAVTTLIGTDAAGRRFNSPNDLAVHSNGTIYFSDPDFQLGNRTSETGIKGVYRVTPSRQVILVDGTFDKPNGVSLSPDEAALYVADSGRNAIKRFSVAPDGSTSSRSDFATVAEPDGMTVDCAGNLYVASHSPGMIRVFSPDGQPIASMKVEPRLTNLAFGGPDRKTLYFTAGKALFSLPMNVPGLPY